ncbi:MAG: hypothetical protein IPJ01_12565 [Micavibrio sp.]|nr:hypothetical protein [Micavibrio sp.]
MADQATAAPQPLPNLHELLGAQRTVLSLDAAHPNRLIITTYDNAQGEVCTRLERSFDPNLVVVEFIQEVTHSDDALSAHARSVLNVVISGSL